MRTPVTQDDRFESVGRGQQARIVHSEIADRIAFKEGQIINRLVSAYRSNKLTGDMLVGAVASIAEMRSLVGDLETEIQQGIEAARQEIGGHDA